MDNSPVSIEHYENFPVASILCPARLRAPILAIYRFARTADDLADEGDAPATQRLMQLRAYRRELDAPAEAPLSRWPEVFGPLRRAVTDFRLPMPLLHDLLDAFEQDCGNPAYQDRLQLLDYCRRSANPVGRLLLHLNGVQDAQALAQSDAICTALQLINFWQDPSVDLPRGRNYFPLEDVRRHPAAHFDLQAVRDTPATQALLRDLCTWARSLMLRGSPLAFRLPGRTGWELRLVVQGGLRILERIEAMDHRTLAARPRLHKTDLLVMLWRAARMSPSSVRAEALA